MTVKDYQMEKINEIVKHVLKDMKWEIKDYD